jgi:hypothetical protein
MALIGEGAFEVVIMTGVVGSSILLILLVGYFIYELKRREVW